MVQNKELEKMIEAKLIEANEEMFSKLKELADALGYERVSYAEKIVHSFTGEEKAVLKYKWQKKESKGTNPK